MAKLTRSTDPNTPRIDRLRLKPKLTDMEKKELEKLKIQRSARLSVNAMENKATNDLINTVRMQARKMKAINAVKNKAFQKEKEKEKENLADIEAKRVAAQERREARDRKIRKERAREIAKLNASKYEHNKDFKQLIKETSK